MHPPPPICICTNAARIEGRVVTRHTDLPIYTRNIHACRAFRDAARSLLADNLRAVVHQTLCRKIGGGRVAAVEVIVAGVDVKDALRCGAVDRVAASSSPPSVRLNDALRELVACGVISPEEAVAHADSSAVERGGGELRAVA